MEDSALRFCVGRVIPRERVACAEWQINETDRYRETRKVTILGPVMLS